MTLLRPLLLTWVGALSRSVLYLMMGRMLDSTLSGSGSLLPAALVGGLAILIEGLAAWIQTAGYPKAQSQLERGLRQTIVGGLFRGAAAPDGRPTGRFVSTVTDGVERSAAYRATFLGPIIGAITTPLLVLIVMAVFADLRAALLLLPMIPLIPLLIGGFQRAFHRVSSKYRASSRRFAAKFLDAVQGLPDLRQLGAGRREGRILATEAENVRANVMRMLAGNQLVILVTDLLFALGMTALATWIGISGLADGRFTAGTAFSVLLLSLQLLDPIDHIGQFFYVGMGGIAATKEIRKLTADLHTRERTIAANEESTSPTPAASTAAVSLADVEYTYPGGVTVLDHASLTLNRGERSALIGHSGAGKSTILQLIQGLLLPDHGNIYVNGYNTRTTDPAVLRAQSTVVPQTTYLFTGSLAENLRVAAPDATDQDLWEALAAARLDKDVHSWPAGLDTPVGERGLAVSGGQAQRIAIARAFLRDAPILLLDEPTSQVDLQSEALILDALEQLSEGRTVITVAHRAAAIRRAERRISLANGHLQEVHA